MAGRRVPFSHPFFTQDPDEFWSRRYEGMPPEFWTGSGFTGPSGQGPPAGSFPSGSFPEGAQIQSQRTHHRREVTTSGGTSGGDFPSSQIWEQYFGGEPAGGAISSTGEKREIVYPTKTYYIRRPDFQRQTSGSSEIKSDEKCFAVSLDVQQFAPDELDVRVIDGEVLVHAKHEQKEDEHGYVSREFTRKYNLPEDVDPEDVKSSLSADGTLTIEAPKKQAKAIEGQKVPIQFVPAKSAPLAEGEAATEASAEAK
ncbi:alpha-crystallin B chain-like [Amphiura filiformis]|uniref:alpha-crystallin B chain-like n=1 Tax=Amphiura filiformis TaxID=82378 RepID=UPI003B20DAE1